MWPFLADVSAFLSFSLRETISMLLFLLGSRLAVTVSIGHTYCIPLGVPAYVCTEFSRCMRFCALSSPASPYMAMHVFPARTGARRTTSYTDSKLSGRGERCAVMLLLSDMLSCCLQMLSEARCGHSLSCFPFIDSQHGCKNKRRP